MDGHISIEKVCASSLYKAFAIGSNPSSVVASGQEFGGSSDGHTPAFHVLHETLSNLGKVRAIERGGLPA
jgi:hypothetical protein